MSENPTEIFSNPEAFRAHLDKIQADTKNETSSESNNEPIKSKAKESKDEAITKNPSVSEEKNIEAEDTVVDDSNDDEAEDNDVDDSSVDTKEDRFIPKSRLKKEAEKRRVAEESMMKEREERIKLETRLQMLEEMQKKAAEPKAISPTAPDLESFEALDEDSHRLYTRKIRELEQKFENLGKETSQRTQSLHVENIVKAQREQFQKTHADFEDALNHVTDVELKVAMRHFKTADEAKQAVANKFAGVVQNAIKNGKNAPEIFYDWAKDYGYTAKEVAEKKAPKDDTPDLDAIKRNKEKSASINSIGNKGNIGSGSSNVVDISQALRDPKNPASGIDPDKFQRLLKKAR